MDSMDSRTDHVVIDEVENRGKTDSGDIGTFQSRFLSILKARKEEVEKALDLFMDRQNEYKQLFSEVPFIENLDQAEREIATNTYYTLLERKTRELKKIEFLINRMMKEDEFGLCEECGEKIPEERLLIIPEANLCVPCQRELEKMDSRRKSAERSHNISLGEKRGFQWQRAEDYGDDGKFIIETDMEGLSFHDWEETEIENAPAENREIKDSLTITPESGLNAIGSL